MVAGNVLVRDEEILVADEAAVRAEAQVYVTEVARHAAADPVRQGIALLEAMQAGQL